MPIGKNALKRVTNNGYSKVAASAPDMENSTVETAEETNAPVKVASVKAEPKKNTAPKTKKAPTKAPAVKKIKDETKRPDGFVRYSFGDALPEYLL